MFKFLKNNYWLALLLGLFLVTRFLGFGQLYHQDEYRWASIVNPFFGELIAPHPPINQLALGFIGGIFGYNSLRLVPILFSFLSLILVYLISLKLSANKKTALLAVGLTLINVYSLIASLQIDIDGALLPFWGLFSYYFYLRVIADKNKKFLALLAVGIIGGFSTKLSFALFVGALLADYLLRIYSARKLQINIKQAFVVIGGCLAILLGFYYFYASGQATIIKYAENFRVFNFGTRAYFDLGFKLFKSLIWLSPLLAVPFIAGLFKREILSRYRFWFIYVFFNLVFYLVLFDFTKLTIERYFMFMIIPCIFVSADILNSLWQKFNATPDGPGISLLSHFNRKYLVIGLGVLGLLIALTISINQTIVPLNPKSVYIDKVKSLDFNFLIPLTGGSGPIGFYASTQFILWSWLLCLLIFLIPKKKIFLYLFLVVGVGYNIGLASEYLYGGFYGSVNNVTKQSLDYIIDKKEIKEIITYYDIGAYYLRLNDKYHSRFYTAPSRDYSKKLTEYRGHYLIVDFPAIDKKGQYWELISRCPIEEKFVDKKVEAYIFNCTTLKS